MKALFNTLFCFSLCLILNGQTGKIITKFKAPGEFCTGMTFDGKNLWVADRNTDKIYCIDPNNGNVLKNIESPAYWPMGLTWDGKYLWNADIRGVSDICEDYDGKIFKIDPETGNILKTLRSPSPSPRGLCWDGKYLWCCDNSADKIIQFSTEDGATIHSFPSPAKDPQGMTYDGKYLWISDRTFDEIYMVDPATGYVIIVAPAPGPHTRGLTFANNSLWAVDFETDEIYKLKVRDGVKYLKTDEKSQVVTYKHQVKNFGHGKILTLDVNIAIPEERPNQEILNITYNKEAKINTDQWGQKTADFNYTNLETGSTVHSEMKVTFKSWNVRYFIYPQETGSLSDIPKDLINKYLDDSEKYQLKNPTIVKTVKDVVGNETNPYWIMRKIHQFLIKHLYYKMDGAWDTAPTVINNGHGSCSEYTFTFIALCRAAGLPARYVGATWIKGDVASMDEVFHRWPEVYLPNYGWISIDPTHGDRKSPRDQMFPIGLIRNKALITTTSGGNSNSLEWSYNANESYTTEPKTNINIQYFADWGEKK